MSNFYLLLLIYFTETYKTSVLVAELLDRKAAKSILLKSGTLQKKKNLLL